MDAREQLRRYLEQRRDQGESELVLDSMSVDDVMRVLGVPGGDRGAPVTASRSSRSDDGPVDWRAMLRPDGEPDVPPASSSRSTRSRSARPAAEPGPAPPRSETAGETEAVPTASSAAPIPLDRIPTGISFGAPESELIGVPPSTWSSLADIARVVGECTLCPLASGARNPVPGEGNPSAKLVCVGEAPGATEDELGRPFVGRAGQLLTQILAAIKLSREEVFICNVLKHRPPGNRNPEPEEVKACSPYLVRQIQLIRPRVILALGTFASQTLLQTREPIGKLRGKIHRYYGVPLIVTYHPAALLRNPSWKRPTWEDVKLARRLLDRPAIDA